MLIPSEAQAEPDVLGQASQLRDLRGRRARRSGRWPLSRRPRDRKDREGTATFADHLLLQQSVSDVREKYGRTRPVSRYTPSLKDLRNHCFTVKIPACDRQRIAKRLENVVQDPLKPQYQRFFQICSNEGIDAKRNVLLELADQCHCDVRLCVNTLQFMYTGANRTGGASGASVGPSRAQREELMSEL